MCVRRHGQKIARRLRLRDQDDVGEAVVLAHDLPGELDAFQGPALGERQQVEPKPVARERFVGGKQDIAPWHDGRNSVFQEVATIGRIAQSLLQLECIRDEFLDIEIPITGHLATFLRCVGQEAQGLQGGFGARRGDLLHFCGRRAQGQQMHAAKILQPLQNLSLLRQQATQRKLLEGRDAHVGPRRGMSALGDLRPNDGRHFLIRKIDLDPFDVRLGPWDQDLVEQVHALRNRP